MKKTILIGTILAVFLMLLVPNISSIGVQTVEKTVKVEETQSTAPSGITDIKTNITPIRRIGCDTLWNIIEWGIENLGGDNFSKHPIISTIWMVYINFPIVMLYFAGGEYSCYNYHEEHGLPNGETSSGCPLCANM